MAEMRETDLALWLQSPETKLLVAYLRQRRAAPLKNFLAGTLVDPVTQGRAAAWHELETLLTSSAEDVRQQFTVIVKGS
jgi:hypothetical protein